MKKYTAKELLEYILQNWDDKCVFVENKYDILYGTERLSYKKPLSEIGAFLGYERRNSIHKILYGQTKTLDCEKYAKLLSWAYALGFNVCEEELKYIKTKSEFLGLNRKEDNKRKEREIKQYLM